MSAHFLQPSVIADAKAHAIREFPKESCGFVVAGTYHPCANVAEEPHKFFRFIDDAYDMALVTGALQAVLHSHPNGPAYPSADDMRGQVATGVPWGIIIANDQMAADPIMWGDQLPIPELIGRAFVHGITDCYSLIRDYYRLEREIVIPEYPRSDSWWGAGEDLYSKGFAEAGFVPIGQSEVAPGDVFLMSIKSPVLNHGGVYWGNDLILHHLPNRPSRREPAGIWKRGIDTWLRYEGDPE